MLDPTDGALQYSETAGTVYLTTRRNIAVEVELQEYRCENLKSRNVYTGTSLDGAYSECSE
jgi:hypothetical protein